MPAEDEIVELYDDFDDGELFDGDSVDWGSQMTEVATRRGGNRRLREGWLRTSMVGWMSTRLF